MTIGRRHYHLPYLTAMPTAMTVESMALAMDLHNIAVSLHCYCSCNYRAHKITNNRQSSANALVCIRFWWWNIVECNVVVIDVLVMIVSPMSSCPRYMLFRIQNDNTTHMQCTANWLLVSTALKWASNFNLPVSVLLIPSASVQCIDLQCVTLIRASVIIRFLHMRILSTITD